MLEREVDRSVGIVVIGRNEGARLKCCLASVVGAAGHIIYVDSASTDNSVAAAREFGVTIVDLDPSIPCCAARARNAGFSRLVDANPAIRYVQFVDGDCELAADWLRDAAECLERRHELAIVAGGVYERFPDQSIYNRLADLEWNIAGTGEVDAVGGVFMIRREAFEKVGGFDPTVVAGEEPELCRRLIGHGWRIFRLDRKMASHDLAITRFGQWWKREMRNGYGALDIARRFGLPDFQRMTVRARFWTAWPMCALAIGIMVSTALNVRAGGVAALLAASVWPVQFIRLMSRTWRSEKSLALAVAYAWLNLISFWPQMTGQLRYLTRSRNDYVSLSTRRQWYACSSQPEIHARDKNAESISG
jgi:GT2 family glycosyltransferase